MANHVKYDLTGVVFGKLTVLGYGIPLKDPRNPNWIKETTWLCRCECGNERTVRQHDLLRGDGNATRSCGCSPKIETPVAKESKRLRKADIRKIDNLKTKLENSNVPFEWHEDEDMWQICIPCIDANKRVFSIYQTKRSSRLTFVDVFNNRRAATLEFVIARISEYWKVA